MRLILLGMPFIMCSCANIRVDSDKYGGLPAPGMDGDAQDRNNTKYNLMNSSDGRQDPTANVKVWGATY